MGDLGKLIVAQKSNKSPNLVTLLLVTKIDEGSGIFVFRQNHDFVGLRWEQLLLIIESLNDRWIEQKSL